MKLMTVICEYNPFHNGHAYQIKKQKKELGCDGVVCLMSGSFVQRGEPALCDKWARAEMALKNGCDLVLELPVLYSLKSAEGFADGAVALLSKLNTDGYLAFGSECGNLSLLSKVADAKNNPDFTSTLKDELQMGTSYPKAYSCAIKKTLGANYADVLDNPNDVLGIEYIRSLNKYSSRLKPAVILREFGQHDQDTPDNQFLSASGIRSRVRNGEDVSGFMPEAAYDILVREINAGRAPVTTEKLYALLCYILRTADTEKLSTVSGVSEGLENRLLEGVKTCQSISELASFVKSKRYPRTRINRILMNALLGITKEDEIIEPAYARVLGLKKDASGILHFLKDKSQISFITKVADAKLTEPAANRLFALDILATDLYSMLYPQKKEGRYSMDYYRSPVIL